MVGGMSLLFIRLISFLGSNSALLKAETVTIMRGVDANGNVSSGVQEGKNLSKNFGI